MGRFKIKYVASNIDGDWKLASEMRLDQRVQSPSNVRRIQFYHDGWTECVSIKVDHLEAYAVEKKILAIRGVTFDGSLPTVKVNEVDTEVDYNEEVYYGFIAPLPDLVESCKSLFKDQHKVTSVDLSDMDTSLVTDMSYAFYGCSGLRSLDLSTLDTSNVTDMQTMFFDCTSLTDIDLSMFSTGSLANIMSLFQGCADLRHIDLSHWNITGVTDSSNMFDGCHSLEYVKVSECDDDTISRLLSELNSVMAAGQLWIQSGEYLVPRVKLFSGTTTDGSLPVVKLNATLAYVEESTETSRGWDAYGGASLTYLGGMLAGQTLVDSVDIKDLNVSGVTNMSTAFKDCSSLNSINLSNWNTCSCTTMNRMFSGCVNVGFIDASKFDMSNVYNTESMFAGCGSLSMVRVANCNDGTVAKLKAQLQADRAGGSANWGRDGSYLVPFVPSKISVTWDNGVNPYGVSLDVEPGPYITLAKVPGTANTWGAEVDRIVTSFSNFTGALSFQNRVIDIDLSELDTSHATSFYRMFYQLGVPSLDVSHMDTSSCETMAAMFSCGNIVELDCSNFDTSNVTDMRDMFNGCSSLKNLDISNFDMTKVSSMSGMFPKSGKLESVKVTNCSDSSVQKMLYTLRNDLAKTWDQDGEYLVRLRPNRNVYGTTSDGSLPTLVMNNKNFTATASKSSSTGWECDSPRPVITSCEGMCKENAKITYIDVTKLDLSHLTTAKGMFKGCSSLGGFQYVAPRVADLESVEDMFNGCSSLRSICFGDFSFSKVESFEGMFDGCSNLASVEIRDMVKSDYDKLIELLDSAEAGHSTSWYRGYKSPDYTPILLREYFNRISFTTIDSVEPTVKINGELCEVVDDDPMYCAPKGVLNSLEECFFAQTNVDTIDFTGAEINKESQYQITGISFKKAFAGCTNLKYIDFSSITNIHTFDQFEDAFVGCESLEKVKIFDNGVIEYNLINLVLNPQVAGGCSDWKREGDYLVRSFNLKGTTIDGSIPGVKLNGVSCSVKADAVVDKGWQAELPEEVTACEGMLQRQYYINSVDLSNLDTSGVTSMKYMFSECTSLGSVDLRFLNTSNVTAFDSMFAGSVLASADISLFDCGKAATMKNMFRDCGNLRSVDFSGIDLDSVDISNMFTGCNALMEVRVKDCTDATITKLIGILDSSKAGGSSEWEHYDDVIVAGYWLKGTTTDGSIPATVYGSAERDTSVTNGWKYMVSGPLALSTLWTTHSEETIDSFDLSALRYIKLSTLGAAFAHMYALEGVDLSPLDTSEVTTTLSMFLDCHSLKSIDLSVIDMHSVQCLDRMFEGCISLTMVSFEDCDLSSVTEVVATFYKCSALQHVSFNEVDLTHVQTMRGLFSDCASLQSVDFSGCELTGLESDGTLNMFEGCGSLNTIQVQWCSDSTKRVLIEALNASGAGGSTTWHENAFHILIP